MHNQFVTTAAISEDIAHLLPLDTLNHIEELLQSLDIRNYSNDVRMLSVIFTTLQNDFEQRYRKRHDAITLYKPILSLTADTLVSAYIEAIQQIDVASWAKERFLSDVEKLFEENGLLVAV